MEGFFVMKATGDILFSQQKNVSIHKNNNAC
jgi:hypothetical protein